MPVWLKEAVAVDVRHEEARKVRETVEGILADIEKRGDEWRGWGLGEASYRRAAAS